jgi:alanine racemase
MAGYTIDTLAQWTHAEIVRGGVWPDIDHLLTDSRKLAYPGQTAFFALRSERRDGHAFIPDLYRAGVRCFWVDREVGFSRFPEATFLLVPDALLALQQVAAAHRKRFQFPVVGITGSNGKTIVKEWANLLLSPDFRIVRSPRSYNSQIGVPLSVWQMQATDELALIEAGISQSGEMEKLEAIICPEIGIFTHIGEAHAEGFATLEEKVREKLVLFRGAKILIYCRDHGPVHEAIQANPVPGRQLLSWGGESGAEIEVRVETGAHSSVIYCRYHAQAFDFSIPFTDQASVENALHCAALMLHLGIAPARIRERMAHLHAVAMRMELKEGANHTLIINDSYSADRDSLMLALDVLAQQKQHERKTVILSDIFQSGLSPEQLYQSITQALKARGIHKIIGIGPAISAQCGQFTEAGLEALCFPATDSFLDQYHPSWFRDESILLKGARSFAFERIMRVMERKLHQTVLEISLPAVAFNLRQYRRQLQPGTRIMAMVKAFSYGAGAYEIANLLQFHKADWLAVAYADEGVELRQSGIRLPVMVMNPEEAGYSLLVSHDLQPELFSLEMTRSLAAFLESEGLRDFPVHVKLDTGMHRLGFSPEEIPELVDLIRTSGLFRIQTVFSHLVASEDPAQDAFTRTQADIFVRACAVLDQGIGYRPLRHLANTAAIRRHPDLQMDMVRLGIGLYGIDPGFTGKDALQEVSTLRTTIAQVRELPAGQTVGYNRKGVLHRDSRIATIRIGYADGYPRSLGNGHGAVLIRGQRFPTIGHICMDMTMVDITGHPEMQAGEDVVVFGAGLSVAELAQQADTIPYEILTGISQRVQRVYFEE